jgi:hypothetical protein
MQYMNDEMKAITKGEKNGACYYLVKLIRNEHNGNFGCTHVV